MYEIRLYAHIKKNYQKLKCGIFTHSFTYSLSHSLIHSLSHSLTHHLTHPATQSINQSLINLNELLTNAQEKTNEI